MADPRFLDRLLALARPPFFRLTLVGRWRFQWVCHPSVHRWLAPTMSQATCMKSRFWPERFSTAQSCQRIAAWRGPLWKSYEPTTGNAFFYDLAFRLRGRLGSRSHKASWNET